jgi:hypothetical protein
MRAHTLGDRGLAGQQRAEILKADAAGQQRECKRSETDPHELPPTTLMGNGPSHAQATPQQNNARTCRRIGDNATLFFMV